MLVFMLDELSCLPVVLNPLSVDTSGEVFFK